jgi:vacuolar protein sorting-associated protein 33A
LITKDLGVYGSFKNNLHEFALDLMPLDYDLLSMENNDVYKDCFLFSDNTHLFHIAKSIMTLQILYGIIPNIYGKGKCAKIICDMILHMRKEIPSNQEPQIIPKIDNLILIDRTVDNLTPMMTQLTYEGLIDENLGVKYGNLLNRYYKKTHLTILNFFIQAQLEVPIEMLKRVNKTNPDEKKRMIVALNSSDSLFAEIRDKNFNAVSSVLSRTAKELQQAYEVN